MPSNTYRALPWLAIVVCTACLSSCQPTAAPDKPGETAATALPPPGFDELKNATYSGVVEQTISEHKGEWQGKPSVAGGASRPRAGLADGFVLNGDLTGDGLDESVVLLWSSNGGSGTFDYLAVMGRNADGAAYNISTVALGDRTQLVSAGIENNILTVDVVQPGSNDAACCPGQKVQRSFSMSAGALEELAALDQGRQSIADLSGVEWVLSELSAHEPMAANITVTLMFTGDRISGSSGCNRYSGGVSEDDSPGSLKVAMNMAMTMMACPPLETDIERAYLDKLQKVNRYAFQAGKLALSWEDGNGARSQLKFSRDNTTD